MRETFKIISIHGNFEFDWVIYIYSILKVNGSNLKLTIVQVLIRNSIKFEIVDFNLKVKATFKIYKFKV